MDKIMKWSEPAQSIVLIFSAHLIAQSVCLAVAKKCVRVGVS